MKRDDLWCALDDLASLSDLEGFERLAGLVDSTAACAATIARRHAVRARIAGRIEDALCYERDAECYLAQVPA